MSRRFAAAEDSRLAHKLITDLRITNHVLASLRAAR